MEGDGIMLNSYPGQYPGISRIIRISGGTEADAEKFDEELSQILPEKDPSEIPFLNLCLHTAKCPGDSYGNTGRLYLVLC